MPDSSTRNKPKFCAGGKAAFALALKDPHRALPMFTPDGVRIVTTPMVRAWFWQGFIREEGDGYAVTASGANAYLRSEGLLK